MHTLPKVKVYDGPKTDVPLCDQAAVDKEAESWASLWHEKASYSKLDFGDPDQLDEIPIHTITKLRLRPSRCKLGSEQTT